MYNMDEIKELIKVLENSSLSVIELQKDSDKIRLEKPCQAAVMAPQNIVTSAPVADIPQTQNTPKKAEEIKSIKAPIVGVYYSSPSPDSDGYVSVGKKVKKGETVCIIEAMKCMNEIQSEENCEIAEILVDDGDLVEYGQPLFRIK